MRKTALFAIAPAAAAVVIAGCGGYGGGSGYSQASPKATSGAPTVALAPSKFGKILVDATGATLYVRDSDTSTQVTCTGGCATAWPPLIATGTPQAGDGVDASKLGPITGSSSGRRWCYLRPLRAPVLAPGDGVPGLKP